MSSENLIAQQKDGKWAFPQRFKEADICFHDGYAKVTSEDGRTGWIDHKGKWYDKIPQ